MAMALDRSTEAIADAHRPGEAAPRRRARTRLRLFTLGCVGVGAAIVAASKLVGVSSIYPDETPGGQDGDLQAWLLTQIQSVLDYVQNPDVVGLPHHGAGRELRCSRRRCCRCRAS